MNNPLVSIIIPTFNQAHFLKECLDSVRLQSWQNWEAIVINNDSTDNTIEVVNSYRDARIRLVNFKDNHIIAAVRNQGMMQAQGEYLAFLDSDDVWFPGKLQRQVTFISVHSSIQLVASNAIIVDEKSAGTGKKVLPLAWDNRTIRFTDMLRKGCVVTSSVLMRRAVCSVVGYMDENPELRVIEDYEYWLRVLKAFPSGMFLMKNSLVQYRLHQKNSSTIEFLSPKDYPDKLRLVYSVYRDEYPELVRQAERGLVVYQYKNAVYRGLYSLKDILLARNSLSPYERILIFITYLARAILHI
jgi:teichuronic acid biosynthesis glycosyltransferase TuaG